MALKDLQAIDFERLLAVAAEVNDLPKNSIPFYQERYRKLERLIPRIQKGMLQGSSTALQAKERELYNLLSGNPKTVKSQTTWAKEGKPLRLFQAHHKAPLTANAQGFLYMSPVKHYNVTAGINAQGLFLGNDPNNRVSGHVVQHLGDSRIIPGKAGSVSFSWHPGGTKAMRLDLDPNATVKQIKEQLIDFNKDFVSDVKQTLTPGSGSIQDAVYDSMDVKLKALGLDLKARTTPGPVLFKQLNKYRREILDNAAKMSGYGYELRAGFTPNDMLSAWNTISENKVGAVLGAINPEAVKSTLQGEYQKAAGQALVGGTVGVAAQQAAKKITPTVMKMIPKAGVIGLSRFAGPIGAAVGAVEMLDAIVEGATGKNLQETGVAAEQTKQKLKEEGYSDYELRRRARTGYKKPQKAPLNR